MVVIPSLLVDCCPPVSRLLIGTLIKEKDRRKKMENVDRSILNVNGFESLLCTGYIF